MLSLFHWCEWNSQGTSKLWLSYQKSMMARCNGHRNGVHTKEWYLGFSGITSWKRLISSKWVYKLKQGLDHVETYKAILVARGWWVMCWDRFWKNIFSYCEMGNIMDDSSLNCSIILGIISLRCENCFFEWKTPGKSLHDSTQGICCCWSRKLFTTWDKHRVLSTQR